MANQEICAAAFEFASVGDEEDSHLGDFIEDNNAILHIDAAIQSNLRKIAPREERVLRMRCGIGMNRPHAGRSRLRAHPPDGGEGAKEAEAPVEVEEAEELFG